METGIILKLRKLKGFVIVPYKGILAASRMKEALAPYVKDRIR